jgi:hypothetical protein
MLGVDRERRAVAAKRADDLARARALLRRGSARPGRLFVVESIAIGAAGADSEGARRSRGAHGRKQQRCGRDGGRKATKADHESPSPEEPADATRQGFPAGERGARHCGAACTCGVIPDCR